MDQQPFNPLAKHFRQPAIYLKLPSQGNFWPEGSINLPLNNEIPILPMSTRDEVVLKTPDALLNGQGVVDVIQSCCPNIVDAWQTPSIDVDAIIIAIRIASYGQNMDVTATCPHCSAQSEYTVNLTQMLSTLDTPSYDTPLSTSDLSIKLKPQAYFSANKTNMIAFEEQQIIRSLGEIEQNPDQASVIFNLHLNKLVDLNIELLAGSTEYIKTAEGITVSQTDFIVDFYKNCDPKIVKQVRSKLDELIRQAGLKPISVACTECSEHFDLNITFDFSSFFGKGS